MASRVAIIQGHPDPARGHLCHALANAYATGCEASGHSVTLINVAGLDFPWLRTKQAFEDGKLPTKLQPSQDAIGAADHLLIVYPLWLGGMPALLKAFFEQIFRPGFAFSLSDPSKPRRKRLKGKSVRIVVTMGMPSLFYRWYFGAHSLKSLERNILGFCGIGPIRESLFGMVETAGDAKRKHWLEDMHRLGQRAR